MRGLTAERLREVLDYDRETGVFAWKVTTSNRAKAGTIAGHKHIFGYTIIMVDGHRYPAHRLAWLYQTGKWPNQIIDHINGCPNDNRFSNLREATHVENSRNSRKPSNNTSGFKGVRLDKRWNRWVAEIRTDGKRKSLGRFDTPDEAYAAYCAAAEEYHGQFARID